VPDRTPETGAGNARSRRTSELRPPAPGSARIAITGVTPRALLVALALLLVLLPVSFFVEQVTHGMREFSARVPPLAALGLAFLLTAANHGWARRRPGRGMSRREILVIYVLLTIGGPLVSLGVMQWFLSCPLGPQYYAHTMPQWQDAFLREVPAWFHPRGWAAAEGFFQGDSAVPWSAWWVPLAAWSSFFAALFGATLCTFLLLGRQWIRHERLTFPVAQVPLEAVRESGDGSARLPAAPAFWLGFAACSLLVVWDHLARIYPSLPRLALGGNRLLTAGGTGPLVGFGDLWLCLWPWCIALAYLMPKELTFSMWCCWFIRVACTMAAIAAGAAPRKPEQWGDSSFPAPYYQGGGAMIALGLLLLWTSRRQIAHALRAAGTGSREAGDGLAYRWVVLGLAACVGYLVLFCCRAGMRPGLALALVGLILAAHLVWARLRAENGMAFIEFPLPVDSFMLKPFGNGLYRPAEIITILATRWSYSPGWGESCEVITGSSMDALKISDAGRIRGGSLTLAIGGVFALALALGSFIELSGTYHYGYYKLVPLPGWQEMYTRMGGAEIYDAVTNPSPPDPAALAALAAGAAVTLGLAQLRLRFWWWPLHPVGYLAANVWGAQWWWSPLFIGWLLKSLTVRYGGLRLYQRLVPAAIGVIAADSTAVMLAAMAESLAKGLR
jgi:hypothetical protein